MLRSHRRKRVVTLRGEQPSLARCLFVTRLSHLCTSCSASTIIVDIELCPDYRGQAQATPVARAGIMHVSHCRCLFYTRLSMKTSLHLRRAACAAPAASGTDVYDVVVVGGGMVGAAFGALLLSHPLTAALRVLVRAASSGSEPALPALAGPWRAVRLSEPGAAGRAVLVWEPQAADCGLQSACVLYTKAHPPGTAQVLDRAPPPAASGPLPPVPGQRVSTLTPASARHLERAGAWRDVAPPRSAAFDTMQAGPCSLCPALPVSLTGTARPQRVRPTCWPAAADAHCSVTRVTCNRGAWQAPGVPHLERPCLTRKRYCLTPQQLASHVKMLRYLQESCRRRGRCGTAAAAGACATARTGPAKPRWAMWPRTMCCRLPCCTSCAGRALAPSCSGRCACLPSMSSISSCSRTQLYC